MFLRIGTFSVNFSNVVNFVNEQLGPESLLRVINLNVYSKLDTTIQ